MKLANFIEILFLFEACLFSNAINENLPTIMITWNYGTAAAKAWDMIYKRHRSALDVVEEAGTLCELEQCRNVGFGGNPDENGETTLDAMIMDGATMEVGAVTGLRKIKRAISLARKVLHHTKHTVLSGELAIEFAKKMGFKEESLTTNLSSQMWKEWKANKCQPNFWKNVEPNPKISCGPYTPIDIQDNGTKSEDDEENTFAGSETNHDTIGILAIDFKGDIAAGTSSNGLNHKIPGRVGDSSIPGSGAYADQEAGAAVCTGDGDIMMRFVPSFLAVELMRRGTMPAAAAQEVMNRMIINSPKFFGAIIVMNIKGEYGIACNGVDYRKQPFKFPFWIGNRTSGIQLNFFQCSTFS